MSIGVGLPCDVNAEQTHFPKADHTKSGATAGMARIVNAGTQEMSS